MRTPEPIGGKVVVITGAARGIGAALAERLADRGARVALVGLEPEQLAAVAARCGRGAAWFECDVTSPEALAETVAGVEKRFGGVDVLVANAGIAMGSPLRLSDPDAYDRVIEVNLMGSIRTVRAFLPLLIRSRGYYLQIASLAALSPTPMITAYGASKAGVEAFALGLRTELAGHGVGAGVAYLSFTDTDMGRVAGRSGRLRLHDLDSAIGRLVSGIERRSTYVYGQRFIRLLRPVRGVMPGVVHLLGRGPAARFETSLAQAGPQASSPIGPGGRADTKARTAPDPEPSA
ncbi:SDR family oxidoreductase [Kineosporia succinea]|uniref:NAD(P)-dependent dehydrogenase (Short-subunit alcohol dehydrogenase family) n=1 Tax=Kineosporia succinea TaxID=84632 RepID=A0ABT9P0A9_9ACTN|nr:SDR family oxidoreductase [Kineosporia succinea]MDP9825947.1 NAD(P)-dependent dehydrogenase (short-subunit alcohol dehydrogenase family) [Kineosporia succinea]